ncbi:hypothetical protein LH128_15421 [Sphingomonas sp. LH128]|nr:hypothetical protein LH128_15421 [Sphingomonas sp. LH128]
MILMTRKPSLSFFGRIARWTATLAGAGLAAAAPAQAEKPSSTSVDPAAAPAEWVRYAEIATVAVTRQLEAGTETAARLRASLDATRPALDQPTRPFVLKIWIDADGTVSRIDHAPFADAQANADLNALLVGESMPSRPPKDMLLPLRVLIELPPAPPAARDGSPALDDANRRLQPPPGQDRPVTDPLGLPERGGVNRLNLEGQPGSRPHTHH